MVVVVVTLVEAGDLTVELPLAAVRGGVVEEGTCGVDGREVVSLRAMPMDEDE